MEAVGKFILVIAGVKFGTEVDSIEFDDAKRIAWQTRPGNSIQAKLFGGRIWRYELEPAPGGGTLVRESWDVSKDHQRSFLKRGKVADYTRANMEKTLARIESLTATSA